MGSVGPAAPWADDPIGSSAADEFDRVRFAEVVARSIEATPPGGDSRVFGLIGPWGSGKSSVVNLVRELLPDSWGVGSFTAWAVPEGSSLQLEFTATLESVLDLPAGSGDAVKAAVRRYSAWGVPMLKLIPSVGGAVADVGAMVAAAVADRKPWDVEFGRLTGVLRSLEQRVLIVCDDIDRLDPAELLEFLKVVRLLGRFPNVHYLVVYDVDTVEALLASAGVDGRRSSFMEKIVQHPFELPAVDAATAGALTADTLQQLVDLHGAELDPDEQDRGATLVDLLSRGLRTPRQQIRFREHVRVFGELVAEEVDLFDFAAVEYLRLNQHEVFNRLPEWAPDARRGIPKGSERGLTADQWMARLAATASEANAEFLFEVLSFLFPELRGVVGGRHPRAFADEEYLERYYRLGVPVNDVSDRLVEAAVDSILVPGVDGANAMGRWRAIVEGADLPRARLAVAKGHRHRQRRTGATNPVGEAALVRLLASLRLQDDSTRLGSPAVALRVWLESEVLRAWAEGAVTREQLTRWIDPDVLVDVLLAVVGSGRMRPVREAMLTEFAAHFRAEFAGGDPAVIQPVERARRKLVLLARHDGLETLAGVLDAVVAADPDLFLPLTKAFVQVNNWYSGGPAPSSQDLAFETELWRAAFSRATREALMPLLPDGPPLADVDEDDLSAPNVRRFAAAAARAAMDADPT